MKVFHNAPPSAALASTKARLLRRVITVGAYLVLLCVDVGFSHWDELFGRDQCGLVHARNWYQRAVTLGYRKPRPHFVRVVTVDPPAVGGPCKYRSVLAGLLDQINNLQLQPKLIVLDYSFSPHDCGNSTRDLDNAIQSLARQAPVVFGISSSTMQEVSDSRRKPELEPLKQAGFGPDDQAIWPSDIAPDGSTTMAGLYRLDCDTRRIPIDWPVFEKQDGKWVRESQPMRTIAFIAAALSDRVVASRSKLKSKDNPFASFIPEELFDLVETSGTLDGKVDPREWKGQIVVIGDALSDMHDSVVGRVPGVVLQANYIESLLDDRSFTGLGPIAGAVATFVCLFVVGAIFDKTPGPWQALSRSAFFLLLLMFVSYLALVYWARLFTFWAPCLVAIPPTFLAKLHG